MSIEPVAPANQVDSRRDARRQAQRWFTEASLREISRAYDERETSASRALALAIALVDLGRPPRSVLDVGSGDGEGLLIARRSCPDATLTGLDPSPEACACVDALGVGDARVVTGSADEIPAELLERAPFDLVLVHLNWALWDDPVAGVRGLAELLNPDGLLFVVDVEGSERSAQAVLSTAASDDERRYLCDQIAASFTEAEARRALGALPATLSVNVRRGGLGGYAFLSPEAARYARAPSVARALRGFPASPDPEAADAVLHVRVRKRRGSG